MGWELSRDYTVGGSSRARFVPFFVKDVEIRRVVYTTDAIESTNVRHRRAVRACVHLLRDTPGLQCSCLVARSLDSTAHGARWAVRWKPTLNTFAVAHENRFKAAKKADRIGLTTAKRTLLSDAEGDNVVWRLFLCGKR